MSDGSAHGYSLQRGSGSVSGWSSQAEERSVPRGGAFRSAVRDLKQKSRTAAGETCMVFHLKPYRQRLMGYIVGLEQRMQRCVRVM